MLMPSYNRSECSQILSVWSTMKECHVTKCHMIRCPAIRSSFCCGWPEQQEVRRHSRKASQIRRLDTSRKHCTSNH